MLFAATHLVYFRNFQKTKDTGGNMLLKDENTLPEYLFTGKKFLRRKEITEEIRFPLQYLKKTRLHHARTMMVDRGLNATEAGFHVGYTNPSQFSREFKSLFGLAPRQLLKSMTE